MKLNKMVFDDKKIEAAANKHIETEYARYNSGEVEEEIICNMTGNNEYLANGHFGFGNVIQFLKEGKACRRSGWNGKGLFIVKQVPSHIEGDIIPNMQSLPQSAKNILMSRENPHIDYTNQMLIINPDGRADSWVPSSSDVFAEDWEVVTD